MTSEILSRFGNLNDEQEKLIYEIGERLHAIYSRREPNCKQGATEQQVIEDFKTAMDANLSRVYSANDRLRTILNHLNIIA